MQEAEVAQQLFNDLQANIGIVAAAILALAIIGLITMTAVASNAARAMREVRETLSAGPAASVSAARTALMDQSAEPGPAFTSLRYRPAQRRAGRDLISAASFRAMPDRARHSGLTNRPVSAAHWTDADSSLRPQRPRPQGIQRRLI